MDDQTPVEAVDHPSEGATATWAVADPMDDEGDAFVDEDGA